MQNFLTSNSGKKEATEAALRICLSVLTEQIQERNINPNTASAEEMDEVAMAANRELRAELEPFGLMVELMLEFRNGEAVIGVKIFRA